MFSKKDNAIIFILLFALVIITGCANKNDEVNNNQKDDSQNWSGQPHDNQMARWSENFDEANLDSLQAGQRILVMGTENSDGSISANQVMIGDAETDFENMGRAMFRPVDDSGGNQGIGEEPKQPTAVSGQRPDFAQMQNMSEEERTEAMEKMRAQREANGGVSLRNMGGDIARISGEIIDKDESVITLKLAIGGSKLIFYSSETKVLKFKIDE